MCVCVCRASGGWPSNIRRRTMEERREREGDRKEGGRQEGDKRGGVYMKIPTTCRLNRERASMTVRV